MTRGQAPPAGTRALDKFEHGKHQLLMGKRGFLNEYTEPNQCKHRP
jgi:hypothetical protein